MIHRVKLHVIDAALPEPHPAADASPSITGLGDIVHIVAQPVARFLDRHFHTDLENCSGCHDRRAYLNRALPLTSPRPHAD